MYDFPDLIMFHFSIYNSIINNHTTSCFSKPGDACCPLYFSEWEMCLICIFSQCQKNNHMFHGSNRFGGYETYYLGGGFKYVLCSPLFGEDYSVD